MKVSIYIDLPGHLPNFFRRIECARTGIAASYALLFFPQEREKLRPVLYGHGPGIARGNVAGGYLPERSPLGRSHSSHSLGYILASGISGIESNVMGELVEYGMKISMIIDLHLTAGRITAHYTTASITSSVIDGNPGRFFGPVLTTGNEEVLDVPLRRITPHSYTVGIANLLELTLRRRGYISRWSTATGRTGVVSGSRRIGGLSITTTYTTTVSRRRWLESSLSGRTIGSTFWSEAYHITTVIAPGNDILTATTEKTKGEDENQNTRMKLETSYIHAYPS